MMVHVMPRLADKSLRVGGERFPASGLHEAEAGLGCSSADVADVACCFASELEQDIAALEKAAQRCGWVILADDEALGSDSTDLVDGDDLDSCDQGDEDDDSSLSESDSEEAQGGGPDMEDKIRTNARMIAELGRPMQPGAWKGCCKSSLCDREDRHRGLCNHRATIPGPAATMMTQDDACSSDCQNEVFCATPSQGTQQQERQHQGHQYVDAAAHQLSLQQKPEPSKGGALPHGSGTAGDDMSSGGHSQTTAAAGECGEREVDSAAQVPAGGVQQARPLPQLPPQQQQQRRRRVMPLPQAEFGWPVMTSVPRTAASGEDELFAMPAVYQPLVKDLHAPELAQELAPTVTLPGMDPPSAAASSAMTTQQLPKPWRSPPRLPLAASSQLLLQPSPPGSTAATPTAGGEGDSTQTAVKAGFSAPSSPSCASAAATADGGTFSAAAASMRAGRTTAAVSVQTPASTTPAHSLASASSARGALSCRLLPLTAVHPPPIRTGSTGASAARPRVLQRSLTGSVDSNLAVQLALCGATSTKEAAMAALAVAAGGMPTGAGASKWHSVLSSSRKEAGSAAATAPPRATATATPASAASGAPSAQPLLRRAPRIKQRPRRPDDPPRTLLEPHSPKMKKRPASRMAVAPCSGHSCTQCGAVSTPVWRAGPAGPKTLCNACGVRYMKVAKRK